MGMEPPMTLRDRLQTALKDAMRAREADRLSTLRLINAAIKDREIAYRGDGTDAEVGEDEILAILGRMVKQRNESNKTQGRIGPQKSMQEKETVIFAHGAKPFVPADAVKAMAP